MLMPTQVAANQQLSDEEVVARVLDGDVAMFELLMRRYNQRLYRVARSILADDAEAEDVMQDAYVRAYQHLRQYAGEAKFSTWLTKIAVYEALARKKRRSRTEELEAMPDWEDRIKEGKHSPEQNAFTGELRVALESAMQKLPDTYRAPFVLREIEGMSTSEVADCLGISEPNAKVRVHRAKILLRKSLYSSVGENLSGCFDFHLSRCDRVVSAVMRRIGENAQA
jgi:RNA polymerase sigma-70 factor, ECF subfamily